MRKDGNKGPRGIVSSDVTRKPLRLWPGVAIAIVQCLAQFVAPLVNPEWVVVGVLGGLLGTLAILLWWLLFSRARWMERVGALVLMIGGMAAAWPFLHISIAKGAMGRLYPVLAIPALGLALVAWAVATRSLSGGIRRATMVATILAACGGWALIRTGGLTASFDNDLHWRWTPTPEDRLLARAAAMPAPPPPSISPAPSTPPPASAPSAKRPSKTSAPAPIVDSSAAPVAAWSGFRGPARDGVVEGLRIRTDWNRSPPVELWRREVGPGWSSFAVSGDLIYTQEQRGPEEVVACYRLSTGEPVWMHRDEARFWESVGGAGPRATPTLHGGRLYTHGATGIVNALDARTGAAIWSRNAAADTATKTPGWGFASSPLIVDGTMIVASSGTLVAYDAATGASRWVGAKGGASYSSPHLATIGGVPQVVMLSASGAVAVAPADGAVLWEHKWPSGVRIVQPAATPDGFLVNESDMMGTGIRRIAVSKAAGAWTVEERWTSTGLKPYFNDIVVHDGHAYGFDGSIMSCIDLQSGARKWKGGRYGNGQLVLLRDQALLLVVSEEGGLALVKAAPDGFTELARAPALEGKTWGHPVVVGDRLLVRNGFEMAAFRLARADR